MVGPPVTPGLSSAQVAEIRRTAGANVLPSHRVTALRVLLRQLRNPLLVLLVATAAISIVLGEHTDAAIILAIQVLSVGLGFVNEYRSERALEDLHRRVHRHAVVWRDGTPKSVDASEIVPGDLVEVTTGDVVPADLRLVWARDLMCDESALTGEAEAVEKRSPGAGTTDRDALLFMGTVVRDGRGRGVVLATGSRTAFGTIAQRLVAQPPVTAFQKGLHDFSTMLVTITAIVTIVVFAVNAVLGRSPFESLLFSLALAIGLTPQLLPAIVTVSLATGARRLAERSVIVKRLVAIEDLGNIEVLFTDKTGTLTRGELSFVAAYDADGKLAQEAATLGVVCSDVVAQDGGFAGNPLDCALWAAVANAAETAEAWRRIDERPFEYERKSMAVLAESPAGERLVIVKGAPEVLFGGCASVSAAARAFLDRSFESGQRVVAVAARAVPGVERLEPSGETGLELKGFLVFADPVKSDAAASLARLRALRIEVKIVTGDNERVAAKVCGDLGLDNAGIVNGAELDALDDVHLQAVLPKTTIFARVTPEQKSRVIRVARRLGLDAGFLGDGVNDAVALHDADVGISVDSAVDVAKDAADVVLLEKDLGILADGVVEGRHIFTNTIKYVLMGTSSNFGNLISTAIGSLVLPFLPLLPSQILLNNLTYDLSEMTIPTDNVDEEQLLAPSRWDMRFIRRFMVLFGPLSSIFDLAIFAIMIFLLHAGPSLFRTGFFVEGFLTQTVIVFVIRTRRVPFFRSRASRPLMVTTLAAAAFGTALPFLPIGAFFGFERMPLAFLGVIAAIVVVYAVLVEAAKAWFYKFATT